MQQEYHFKLAYNEIAITPEEILKISGNNIPEQHDFFLSAASTAVNALKGCVAVTASIALREMTVNEESIQSGDISFMIGKKLTKFFSHARLGAFFVATAGYEVQQEAQRLSEEGLILESYFVDLLGSTLVENGMDRIQEQFAEICKQEGLNISNRYSPGYCNWEVASQHELFKLIPNNKTGVTLTPSGLMQPIKSISGVIGVGENVKFAKHQCDLCNSRDCIYRGRKTRG